MNHLISRRTYLLAASFVVLSALLIHGVLVRAELTLDKVGPEGSAFSIDQVAYNQGGFGGNGFLEMARGYGVESAFQSGLSDSVMPFNGNLNLQVPIGGKQMVGTLDYSLNTVYNSRLWEWVVRARTPCTPEFPCFYDQSMPMLNANAGFGWTVSLGEIYEPWSNSTNAYTWPNFSATDYLYIGQSGQRTALSCDSKYPGSNCANSLYPKIYTDSGYRVRMLLDSQTALRLQMPGGITHHFARVYWEGCPTTAQVPAADACWRLTRIDNRAGNWIALYHTTNNGAPRIEVSDSINRRHIIDYALLNSWDTRQGTTVCWQSVNPRSPNECGEYKWVVKTILTNAHASQTSQRYSFNYANHTLRRATPHQYFTGEVVDADVELPLLESITMPVGGSYQFQYSTQPADNRYSGVLTKYTLPTGGSVDYAYNVYTFPKPCGYDPRFAGIGGAPHFEDVDAGFRWSQLPGVVERRATDPFGTTAVTKYEQQGRSSEYNQRITDPCRRPNSVYTKVTGPANAQGKYTATYHHYSVAHVDNGGWRAIEYGMPINRSISLNSPDAGKTLYLSTSTSTCTSSGSCSDDRETYVDYATRTDTTPGVCEPGDAKSICARQDVFQTASLTRYLDDGNSVIGELRSDYDGFGNARSVHSFSSGFRGSSGSRTAYGSHNPQIVAGTDLSISAGAIVFNSSFFSKLPSASQTWQLYGPRYAEVSGVGAATQRTDFCYRSNGLLAAVAKRKASNDTSEALITLFGYGTGTSAGLQTRVVTTIAGVGDWSQPCDGTPTGGTGDGQLEMSYQWGQLATKRDPGLSHYTVDKTIDGFGRTTSERAPNLVQSDYQYDALGRLTSSSLSGRASKQQTYTARSGSNKAKVAITRGGIASTVEYDGFGRPLYETQSLPGGGTRSTQIVYDALGQVASARVAGATDSTTIAISYDAFGRKTAVTDVDGSTTTMSYSGDRISTVNVGGTYSRTEFDAYRRPYRVSAGMSSPTGTPIHCTEYAYDHADRAVTARRYNGNCGGSDYQDITHVYDGRGFLISEKRPESAAIGYSSFTSAGLPKRTDNGVEALSTEYDSTGRPTVIRIERNHRLMLEWVYGGAGCSGNYGQYCAGQVIAKRRHHWIGNTDYVVENAFQYASSDPGGSATKMTTTVAYPDANGSTRTKSFTQDITVNALGQLSKLSYPDCGTTGCGSAPARAVSYEYDAGVINAVWVATGTASAQRLADLKYNAVGNLNEIRFDPQSSTATTSTWYDYKAGAQQLDRVRVKRGTINLFDSGAYAYLPTDSVSSIGSNTYTYDRANRLVGANFDSGGGQVRGEGYTYDAFDFMSKKTTTRGSTTSTVDYQPSPSKNNRIAAMTGRSGFAYDNAGRMTNDGCFLYEYDALGQVVAQQPANPAAPLPGCNLNVRHLYDADGLRLLTMCKGCTPVAPPPSFNFSGNPATINYGGSSTLNWGAVAGATQCTASGASDWNGNRSIAGGSQLVSPTGTTTYTLTCSGAGGNTIRTQTVTVLNGCPATITQQPMSVSALPATPVSFSVVAIAPGILNYQWYKNGVIIVGATASNYSIASAQVADTGYYSVKVGSSVCTSLTQSAPATLTVSNQGAFSGTPVTLPGRIDFEHYDVGGEGVAYHDDTPGNSFGNYRNDDVDIFQFGTAPVVRGVGAFNLNEWLEYSLYSPTTTNYAAIVRYAYVNTTAQAWLYQQNESNQIAMEESGSWADFMISSHGGYEAVQGNNLVRFTSVYVNGGSSSVNLDWIKYVPKLSLDESLTYLNTALDSFAHPAGTVIDTVPNRHATPDAIIGARRYATANTGSSPIVLYTNGISSTPERLGNRQTEVSANIDPTGSTWMALGIQAGGKQPTPNGWWSHGLLWVMLKPDGTFNVLVNGHQYSLTNGAKPIPAAAEFRTGQYNLVEMRYYISDNRVAVRINGEIALPATSLPTGFTLPFYNVNGGWGGSVMTKDQSRVDAFVYRALDEYIP